MSLKFFLIGDVTQKIFDWVESCTCTSSPITASHSIVYHLVSGQLLVLGELLWLLTVPVRHCLILVRDVEQARFAEVWANQL